MRIATYNVNGVNGRLPVLLRWLKETRPDVACLQELKAPQEKFPIDAISDAGHVRAWEKTSDHAPVWIELKEGPDGKRTRAPTHASNAKPKPKTRR